MVHTTAVAAMIAADYRLLRSRRERAGLAEESAEFHTMETAVHERNAKRVLRLVERHRGVYVKWGQIMANSMLPEPYRTTMAVVQDAAPASTMADVRAVLAEELGRSMEEVFSEFDDVPVGAASLAQVHRAVLRASGEEVAVKVQHRDIAGLLGSDLRTARLLYRLADWLFPAFAYGWLFSEFEEQIAQEMDFVQEGLNATRARALWCADERVHVPRILWELTTHRVLAMEFVRGIRPTDEAAVRALGVDPKAVAMTACRVFGSSIFHHGLLHCDPHPGNLLLRADASKPGGWELIVLDHGMYRRLDQGYRRAFGRLWRAMLLGDMQDGIDACEAMGLPPEAFDGLSLVFTYRPAGSSARLGQRISKAEVERIKDKYKEWTAQDVNDFLKSLPRDMIFVMRTVNLLRGLNLALGGSTQERLRALGESAVEGIVLDAELRPVLQQLHSHHAEVGELHGDVGALLSSPWVVLTPPGGDPHRLSDPGARVNAPVDAEIAAWLERAGPDGPALLSSAVDSHVVADAPLAVLDCASRPLTRQPAWWTQLQAGYEVWRLRATMAALDLWMRFAWWWFGIEAAKPPSRHHSERVG